MLEQRVQEIVVSKNKIIFFQKPTSPTKKQFNNKVNNHTENLVLHKYIEITHKEGKAGSWGINLTTLKPYISKIASEILGLPYSKSFSQEEILLKVYPNDVEHVLAEWDKIINGGMIETEFRLIIDNKIKWIKSVSSNHWKDENNEMQVIGCIQDITDIKEKHFELEIKQKELDFIIHHIPVSVTQLSPEFKIIFSNYDHENSGGIDFFNHITPEFQENLRVKFTEARQTAKSVSIELKGFGKSLTINWFRLVINKVEGISKDYDYTYLVIGKDITIEKQFQEELIRASTDSEEKERKRIATDLHDGVCQNLVALKLLATKVARENPILLEAFQKNSLFNELKNLIDSTLCDIRRCSYDLMPINLELEGLYGALKTLFAVNNTVTSIKHTLEINAITEPNNFITINIYRIVQEFIHNAQKHSSGTEIFLRISENKHHLIFRLADNGQGFPKTEDYKTGIGTLSMLARIKNIGGTYNVITNTGNGVQLYFSINIE